MRALGLNDTLFYNLRDAQVTAALLLDGPCDLAALVAEVEGLLASLPGFAETPVRRGLWSYARPPETPLDLATHIFTAEAPDARELGDIAPLLERLRRNRIAMTGPPWRIVVLNPAGSGTAGSSPQPLSSVFCQFRHGLADGTRAILALTGVGTGAPTADHAATARRIGKLDLAALPRNIAVGDTGLSLMQVARRDIARNPGGASLALATAAERAVADIRLFPKAQPLRGNIGRTRLIFRRGAEKGVGNHLKMETLPAPAGTAAKRRWRIPGLARAQELPISQWAIALAPSPLARLMMRIWYTSFDAIATLIPMPSHARLCGRTVTAIFGVPPIWAPVPLLVLACADAGHYHMALFPGRGFAADPAALEAKLRRLLSPDKARQAEAQEV